MPVGHGQEVVRLVGVSRTSATGVAGWSSTRPPIWRSPAFATSWPSRTSRRSSTFAP